MYKCVDDCHKTSRAESKGVSCILPFGFKQPMKAGILRAFPRLAGIAQSVERLIRNQ